jgi:hypothetical protein
LYHNLVAAVNEVSNDAVRMLTNYIVYNTKKLYHNLVAAVHEASNDAVRLPETVDSAVVGHQHCHARAPDGQLRTVSKET